MPRTFMGNPADRKNEVRASVCPKIRGYPDDMILPPFARGALFPGCRCRQSPFPLAMPKKSGCDPLGNPARTVAAPRWERDR